jgi:hypothetical protein
MLQASIQARSDRRQCLVGATVFRDQPIGASRLEESMLDGTPFQPASENHSTEPEGSSVQSVVP